jgi:cell division septation protein DedD
MAQLGRSSELRVTASDALEFEPVVAEPRKTRWALRLFAVLVLAAGGAWAWHLYGADLKKLVMGSDGGIPLIKANPAPIKVRPDNPGGLDVPDRDKLVYDRIQGTSEGRGPERLLPPPEQPLPKPRAAIAEPRAEPKAKLDPNAKAAQADLPVSTPAKPVAAVPTASEVASAERPVPPPPPPAPPTASGAVAPGLAVIKRTPTKKDTSLPAFVAKEPGPAKETVVPPAPPPAAVAKAPEPVKETMAPPAPPPAAVAKALEPEKMPLVAATPPLAPVRTPPAVSPDRAYLVQLAAARTQDGAETEWEKLRGKNQDLLGNLRLFVTKADLGAKGVYYRLRAGPITDEAAARDICTQLTKRQVNCLIIKPGQ